MKLIGITVMSMGAFLGVKNYVDSLKAQLVFLKDWEKIFRLWKEWILHFSYSTAELIERTVTDALSCELFVSKMMKNKQIQEIITYIESYPLSADEKQIVLQILKELGNSLTEAEVQSLSHAANMLKAKVSERESVVKEKTTLLYKITPLLCAAAAILIW